MRKDKEVEAKWVYEGAWRMYIPILSVLWHEKLAFRFFKTPHMAFFIVLFFNPILIPMATFFFS